MKLQYVVLLTGSNIGNSKAFLALAKNFIFKNIGKVHKVSAVYKTAAWGKQDQAPFLNQVIIAKTTLLPQQVLAQIQVVENLAQRERTTQYAARTLDVDILFYSSQIINETNLIIPHPHIPARRFALQPLVEIMPTYIHPVLQLTMEALLLHCNDNLMVEKLG